MKKSKPPLIASAPAEIHALSHQGIGIAAVEGKTTFIEGALPGETVKYRIFKKHRHYDEGAALEILNRSPERSVPRCQHFGICGGCSLQHLEAAAQINWKQKILLEQLEHLGQVTPEAILPPLNSKIWEYRHKARLGVRYLHKHHKALVGFREKFRHGIADLQHCHTLHPSIGHRLPALSELVSQLSCKADLPQIEVAIGDQQAALIFRHLLPFTEEDQQLLRHFGRETQIHIYLQPNQPQPISLLWPENASARLSYQLVDFGIEMLFHPSDFTQIHLEMNRLMVKQAVTLLVPEAEDTILDLFCGIGNFSLPLARFAHQVTGIEGSNIMVERAYENAQHNQITNIQFAVENLFSPQADSAWQHQHYHKILLDPPRSGAQEIIHHFPRLGAKRILYVSCNTATLARDAHILVHQLGYQLKKAGMMNMFPHTSHIEAMALFER